ncbi:MAG: hypothetical protein HY925_12660, partial [Elusimicrobia bacterium]|nr:hypothetical protein [Elusimicrobiota bacterium]
MLAWIVALLQLLASLCAAQTRLASFSASEAAAFKAAVVGQDLSVLGVPASLAARLPNLDPNIPAHRLLMAPVALSMQARASDIAGQARALLAEDARQAIAGAARAEAPVSELHSSKSELAALEEAAAAYEMKPMALELAQARDAVWTRIEDSVASAGGKTAQSLSDVPAPRKGILGAL